MTQPWIIKHDLDGFKGTSMTTSRIDVQYNILTTWIVWLLFEKDATKRSKSTFLKSRRIFEGGSF